METTTNQATEQGQQTAAEKIVFTIGEHTSKANLVVVLAVSTDSDVEGKGKGEVLIDGVEIDAQIIMAALDLMNNARENLIEKLLELTTLEAGAQESDEQCGMCAQEAAEEQGEVEIGQTPYKQEIPQH